MGNNTELTNNLKMMIQDHIQRLRKIVESKSSSFQFLLGDEAITSIPNIMRSHKMPCYQRTW